jgi:TolA-binding protein
MFPTRPPTADPRRLALALALVAAASAGCQSLSKLRKSTYNSARSMITSSYHDPEAEAKVAQGEELMQAGHYQQAEKLFNDVADNTYNPVLLAEKARFLEAECLRQRKHYMDAIATYNRQLMDHTAGAYREKACTRIYDIVYKQWLEPEVLADIEAEQAGKKKPWWQRQRVPNPFDDTHPLFDTEGEALKALENVSTYGGFQGPNVDKALFWCGYINFYRGRFEEADHFFSQLVEMHKDSKLRPAALEMAIMSKNNSTGGAVYDTQKAAEALQLVHHAEASEPVYAQDPKKTAWITRQKMAVRMQLAEKDFRTAEYYERTHHPASAYFYYELVCRRYPGTKFSDLAKKRLAALESVRKQMDAERAKPHEPSLLEQARTEWEYLTGKKDADKDADKPEQTGPKDAPRTLPADITNPR